MEAQQPAWLDHIDIARKICVAPIPVIVGIGHQRDKVLLEELSCLACGTPSKVIGHIRSTIVANANEASAHWHEINRVTAFLLDKMKYDLAAEWNSTVQRSYEVAERHQRLIDGFPPLLERWCFTHLNETGRRVQRLSHYIQMQFNDKCSGILDNCRTYRTVIYARVPRRLQEYVKQLDSYQEFVVSTINRKASVLADNLEETRTTLRSFALRMITVSQNRVETANQRFSAHGARLLNKEHGELTHLMTAVRTHSTKCLESVARTLQTYAQAVINLGPKATLERGYAIVSGPHGFAKSVRDLSVGERVELSFKDGSRKADISE